MKMYLTTYLSYSIPNSSWPILGASGSISSIDESEETESHDIARCRRGVPSTGKHSNSEAKSTNRSCLKLRVNLTLLL